MRNSDIIKGLMPDVAHATTLLNFSDLRAQCKLPRVKAVFEEVLEAIVDALRTIEHVKGTQVTGVKVVVLWDYDLPTSHVARRELELEKAVSAVLASCLSELLPAKRVTS